MLSPIAVVLTYATLFTCIPFALNYSNLGDLIPYLSYYLGVDYYLHKIEPIVLCLGLVTFYAYVLLDFLFDIIQACRRKYELGITQNSLLYERFERARRQVKREFPPFVVSCLLMYANTTRFDTLRNSFTVLQTVLLLVQPITCMYHWSHLGLFCKYFYRAVLLWSILYAIFPRESQYYIFELTHLVSECLGLNNSLGPRYYNYNDKHYINSRYSSNNQQWIL